MGNFIVAPAIVGIIFYFTYKFIELLTHRKERLLMVEKISEISSLENADLNKLFAGSSSKFIALRFGAAFLGIGLGLLVAFLIGNTTGYLNIARSSEMYYQAQNIMGVIYGACTLLFGGLALILCFIAEHKLVK